MRLALITTLEEFDEAVVKSLETLGYHVIIVKVRGLSPEALSEALRSLDFDYAIVPGSSPHDYEGLGFRVVKGPLSPYTLPYVLQLAGPDALSPAVQAEKVLGPKVMADVAGRVYTDILSSLDPAFTVGGLKVPRNPPPILVASDIYITESRAGENAVEESSYRFSEGADIVVLSSHPNLDRKLYLNTLEAVMSTLGKPVAADPARLETLVEAVDMGAPIAMSLTPGDLDKIPKTLRDRAAYVIIPGEASNWEVRVESLEKARGRALELGYNSVILDPIVNPPVYRGTLESLIASRKLSKLGAPIMLGLNNAVEMADVDTHASTATLILLAAEAGASIVMVGEESYKARGNTREAARAARIASISLKLKTPPKDLGISILDFKGKNPPEGLKYLGRGRVRVEKPGLEVDCRDESSLEELKNRVFWGLIEEACRPWI